MFLHFFKYLPKSEVKRSFTLTVAFANSKVLNFTGEIEVLHFLYRTRKNNENVSSDTNRNDDEDSTTTATANATANSYSYSYSQQQQPQCLRLTLWSVFFSITALFVATDMVIQLLLLLHNSAIDDEIVKNCQLMYTFRSHTTSYFQLTYRSFFAADEAQR